MLSVREKKLGEQVRIDPPITRGPKSNCSKLSFMTKSNEAEAAFSSLELLPLILLQKKKASKVIYLPLYVPSICPSFCLVQDVSSCVMRGLSVIICQKFLCISGPYWGHNLWRLYLVTYLSPELILDFESQCIILPQNPLVRNAHSFFTI